jgi:transcriptional regulator with XRE-family HTH domain
MSRAYRSLDDYFARTGQSQQELAAEVGVSTATISKWTAGLAMPRAAMLLTLSAHTGVSVENLVRTAAARKA